MRRRPDRSQALNGHVYFNAPCSTPVLFPSTQLRDIPVRILFLVPKSTQPQSTAPRPAPRHNLNDRILTCPNTTQLQPFVDEGLHVRTDAEIGDGYSIHLHRISNLYDTSGEGHMGDHQTYVNYSQFTLHRAGLDMVNTWDRVLCLALKR